MIRIITSTLVFTSALLVSASYPSIAQAQTLAAPECSYSFGTGDFRWCASANGTVVHLASPALVEHIRVGTTLEGYVVCAAGIAPVYDLGAVADGWDAPLLIGTPTQTGVTIQRTTLDGRWTLRQLLRGNRNARTVSIAMTLTNNFEPLANVQILRTADIDMDGTLTGDTFDRSARSVWARQVRALVLSPGTLDVRAEARLSSSLAPRTCLPLPHTRAPVTGTDLAGSVRYDLGTLGSGAARTVSVVYRLQ